MLATHRLSSLGASGAAALGLIVSLFVASDAQADSCRFHSNCGRCGSAVYAYPILAGYDRCGNPVYQWAARPHTRCSVVRQSRGTIYSNRQVFHPGFGGYCPPTVVVPRHYGPVCPPTRGGVTFHFGF